MDFVQWPGPSPTQDTSNWQEIAYKHDVHGRRVEKKVDGYSTRYVYDGQTWHGHLGRVYDFPNAKEGVSGLFHGLEARATRRQSVHRRPDLR